MSTFSDLRRKIDKSVKGVHISILADSEIAKIDQWIQAPTYDFNRILSGSLKKGIPVKSHVVMVGPEASFKTSYICLLLVDALRKGLKPVIIDTEGSWTNSFVERWGLDPRKVLYIYTPFTTEAMTVLSTIRESDEEGFAIAVDSIGGLERKKLFDDTLRGDHKADQGILQKEIKQLLKMLVNICKSKKSIAFSSAHYYGDPSGYGSPEKVGGGKYLKLSADILISLKKYDIKEIIDGKSVITGTGLTACTLKNRFYPPFNETEIEINYISGINKYVGLLNICKTAGIIEQKGAWYTYLKTGCKFCGVKEVMKFFESNKDIIDEIDEYVKNTGYSNINYEAAKLYNKESKKNDDEKEEEKIRIKKIKKDKEGVD